MSAISLREANLSAGSVYRYFKSKDEVIAAIGFTNVAAFTRAIEEVLQIDAKRVGGARELARRPGRDLPAPWRHEQRRTRR
jgi:AcrR family transcriptional regulator